MFGDGSDEARGRQMTPDDMAMVTLSDEEANMLSFLRKEKRGAKGEKATV